MRCSIVDALEWIYPDSDVGTKPCVRLSADVARGGTAAATVLMKDLTPGAALRISVSPRPGRTAQWFRLHDVPVEQNSGLDGFVETPDRPNPFVTRRAPFRVYDAMEPVGRSFEVQASTEAVRVHIPIAPDAKPAETGYCITVSQGKEKCELTLHIVVFEPIIPPVGRESWPYINWHNMGNIASRHGLKPWTEAHWDMVARYAKLMARNRQNAFLFAFGDVFSLGKQGLQLNAQRLERIVRTFSRAGMHYIVGGHFGSRTSGEWKSPTFSISRTGNPATSHEGNADIACAGRQLMDVINRRKWHGRYLQHVADEPIEENAVDYRIFVGMLRKYMPGIPLLDALEDLSLVGSVDVWCPKTREYEKHREHYEAMRRLGDKVWVYTCCFPCGPSLNRLMDMELLRPALLGWACAHFDLDGFLHWGLNMYRHDQDPFEQSVVPHWAGTALPAGDTHVVYPGQEGPWSSVRLESQREGLEDLELLRMLKARNPKKAASILKTVVRGFEDYTTDLKAFRSARRKLLSASL